MNSVVATTYSAVYLAMRHIFPDTPLNAGAFEPLHIKRPEGTFLDARYPRPVSGCAAEVSQRIAEAVFLALVQAIPDKVTAAPAGSSGNFALGGFDPTKGTGYVMYQISGGGYGGNADHDGLTNGCSTIGISKSQPVEVLEQYYPDPVQALRPARGFRRCRRASRRLRRALRGRAAARRGAGLVRDGSRPLRAAGRAGRRRWRAQRGAGPSRRRDARSRASVEGPGYSRCRPGDRVEVMTPGGGGYGDPWPRAALVARDVARLLHAGRRELFGVAWPATARRRAAHGRCGAAPAEGQARNMVAYHRPSTLDEALAIRAAESVTVLAGGTDVYPAKAARAGWGDPRHADILDISALPGLRGIKEEAQAWRIGALTTWTDITRADLPAPVRRPEAGRTRGRRRADPEPGTIAGNLCTASPAGDGVPNLLALDAEVELASREGRRRVPLAEFIDGYRHTACSPPTRS